ncbi:DMT family transporter [Rhodoferax aquaticus]|uniref:DMT family transporter n=1 Tax=Rhodoferax aquaticus TaxID=2527691 RepID=A0A515ESD1_9BURK|nr:DMT family transporter [Rhodoferax aquaticus]QDL55576.1 DMT family transporter [Rhodoferax aquaticus]
MTQRLTPTAALLLVIPPLLWSGNAVVGRLVSPLVSPMTLNLLRWAIALVLLLPFAAHVLRRDSVLWPQWRRFAALSFFSIGAYNALLYLALNTSTPINVTLVGASTPVWMLLIGRLFFKAPISQRQCWGAVLSVAGVVLVLSRGQWALLLNLRLVVGDLYVLMASCAWAYYSWMLSRPSPESASLRADWSAFLMGQIVFGLGWCLASTGVEWTATPAHIEWGWPLISALAFIAVGPAVIAYASWGAGVARAGPAVAGFFINLTPLFTALLSAAFLGEAPQLFHGLAFALIVSGIVLSTQRKG